MKKLFSLLVCSLLFACSSDTDDYRYSVPEIREFSSAKTFGDSLIYIADSLRVTDIIDQSFSNGRNDGDDSSKNLQFHARGRNSSIDVSLAFNPTTYGGKITVGCCPIISGSDYIVFDDPKFPIEKDGYVLSLKDSVKVGNATYRNVLIFDASKKDTNVCNMEKFYYAAEEGLVKIVAKNKMEYTRISESEYEAIKTANIATQDSIAQAVADSIAKAQADSVAKALADSIMKATQDSLERERMDSLYKALETVYDSLPPNIKDAANCIKDLGLGATLSDMKKCLE